MIDESITFRYSLPDKLLFGFGIILMGGLAYVAWINQYGNGMVIIFSFFCLLSMIVLILTFYSITLTNREIIVWRYFQEKRLAWNDIYEVIPDAQDCFWLSDRNGDVKVFISSQVKGYLLLLELIKQKRPEIWQIQNPNDFHDTNIFHKSPWAALYYGLVGIGMMITALIFDDGTTATTFKLFARLLFFCIGLGLTILVARADRKLEFSGPYLVFSHFGGWKKHIHISEVERLDIDQEYYRTTLVNIINLRLKNGKMIAFSGYKEGMPILASAFEKWMETYKAG
jgi:hypothetical protein